MDYGSIEQLDGMVEASRVACWSDNADDEVSMI
jgi:hypothetical protein